jgi:hypothetical protein
MLMGTPSDSATSNDCCRRDDPVVLAGDPEFAALPSA